MMNAQFHQIATDTIRKLGIELILGDRVTSYENLTVSYKFTF
jgi:hypothetical protein